MARLGLFPLPLVLVPTERVPLHIFEPRYRELIGECIERDEEFGVLLEKPGGEAHAVGTRAAVVEVLRRLPDGRMHIAVEGGERFRLLELHDDRSFLEGTIEPVADEDDPPASARRRAGARALPAAAGDRRLDARAAGCRLAAARLRDRLARRLRQRREAGADRAHLAAPALARLVELLEHALEALTLERAVHAVGGRRTARSRRSAAS